jgi:hypothetical protein
VAGVWIATATILGVSEFVRAESTGGTQNQKIKSYTYTIWMGPNGWQFTTNNATIYFGGAAPAANSYPSYGTPTEVTLLEMFLMLGGQELLPR